VMCSDVIDKNTPHDAALKHALNVNKKILNKHSSRQLSEKKKNKLKLFMIGIITGNGCYKS
jgi:hypothetical protein